MQPASTDPSELIRFGWRIAEATLAAAGSELTLVTHWFQTGHDDSVNADEHFGSNARTLRFLGVALPTLIDQLGASSAVVAVPWDVEAAAAGPTVEAAPVHLSVESTATSLRIETPAASLTVVAIGAGAAPRVETRALTRLAAAAGPPFWRLEPGPAEPPAQLARTASRLAL
jgi:hypothetical protein